MEVAIAKCGCDCMNCPTFKGNIRTIEERRRCSAGWEKYLDLKLNPEKLRPCDGCSIPDSERDIYYLNCRVRKCAMVNGMDNCAYCTGFPCGELLEVHSIQKISNRDDFISKTGKEIQEDDYKLFIEPYAGLQHLNKIRQEIDEKDFKDYQRFQVINRFAPFFLAQDDTRDSLERIYALLTRLGVEENVSFARLQTLRNRRKQSLKILWTLAHDGVYNEGENSLELDGGTLLSQKITASYHTLRDYLNELKEHDIHCQVIPITEKDWLTPTGALRKHGWMLRLSFGTALFDSKTLQVFKDYIQRLENRYNKQTFRFLNAADLSIMGD